MLVIRSEQYRWDGGTKKPTIRWRDTPIIFEGSTRKEESELGAYKAQDNIYEYQVDEFPLFQSFPVGMVSAFSIENLFAQPTVAS